jgi:hypothetical protein
MKTVLDKEEMRRTWVLSRWYDKAFYVLGIVYTSIYALSFIIGFIIGVSSGL